MCDPVNAGKDATVLMYTVVGIDSAQSGLSEGREFQAHI